MQRRLIYTIVGVALASIVLVGAGVLLFARIGARADAREEVGRQLEALTDVANTAGSVDRARTALARFGDAFDFSSVIVVFVTDEGNVAPVEPRRGDRGPLLVDRVLLRLETEAVDRFAAGETLVLDTDGGVTGLRLIDTVRTEGLGNVDIGVLVRRDVAPLPPQARTWFVISASIVLAGSVALANWLARRFAGPVKEATLATAAIAAGDLTTRVAVSGDDEIADLARSVNSMAAELERGRAAEQQFLLSVSHDLRTPLTAIAGYAEALRDGAIDEPDRAGQIIGHHADRLGRLVRDLLDLAKLETRQFRFELRPCDPALVAERAVASAERGRPEDVRVTFEAVGPVPTVTADPDRLHQVLDNLIDNAIKFAGSTVTVTVTPSPTGDVVLRVRDDGPGIPAADLPHVFERLYVTQQRPVRAESSTGLGLAIVRELTIAMGGSVRAEADHTGTSMDVTLPGIP